jgi:diguanylate cyclase (GGDEF)-like protein
MSTRDSLTGLGDQGAFHEALGAARVHSSIAVVLVDVDAFTAARGRQAGDRLLVQTAAALSSVLRRGDELFRIGADAFAAVVHVIGDDDALEAARRLRDAPANTVSIGFAVPTEGESDAALLLRAHRALQAVKAAGRGGMRALH